MQCVAFELCFLLLREDEFMRAVGLAFDTDKDGTAEEEIAAAHAVLPVARLRTTFPVRVGDAQLRLAVVPERFPLPSRDGDAERDVDRLDDVEVRDRVQRVGGRGDADGPHEPRDGERERGDAGHRRGEVECVGGDGGHALRGEDVGGRRLMDDVEDKRGLAGGAGNGAMDFEAGLG